ncbi:TPA: DegT/DnrJ/EryC1/StrS family aminotransferase [Legionella pneumophila]|nr:aminotransferase [Legionella pneumophila serogroup 3]BCL64633.1 aminotransferase [Legionella pneumophila serogroup 15]HDO7894216.1 DegT/DnrJ/EryC1/StrS family aminotransferase [Legionella pneumophila]
MQLINNLSARMERHQNAIKNAIDKVIASGRLVLGPEVEKFERSFALYLGANYCVSVGNGTDAIELALKAIGIESGDSVATVANAGMYTTSALLAINAKPYFMDVDLNTHNVTFSEVASAIEANVKAVVVTHLYGLAIPEISLIAEYCRKNGVALLEDCAQAHGATIDDKKVGTFGDVASFSFYPTKNLGALGDGGAIVTNDLKIAEKIRSLRQYGWTAKYKSEINGARNSRLDEIQAAILSEFLPNLDEANARRRAIATTYTNQIKHRDVIVPSAAKNNYVAHLYVIRSTHRDLLREYLYQLNIASEVHYPTPDYRQPILRASFDTAYLQNTERLVNEILTLPCYPEMSNEDVNYVITAINSWFV